MSSNQGVNLPQLEQELADAGVLVNGLGTDDSGVIYSYDLDGVRSELPASAQDVIDAHVPQEPEARRLARERAARLLNATAVRESGQLRDDFAEQIGVQALGIPLEQDAVTDDVLFVGEADG